MDFNLRTLNLWLGLCKGDPTLPDSIQIQGYREWGIERQIHIAKARERCVPELIICSGKTHNALLFEWKSGKNTVDDQLRRYAGVLSSDLIRANVPTAFCNTFDVVIICAGEHVERIQIGLEKGKYTFPLLKLDERGLHLVMNNFACPKLGALFSPLLAFDFNRAPISFVPIGTSSTDWEIAVEVIPKLVSRFLRGEAVVATSTLCSEICHVWDIMSPQAQGEMKRLVRKILDLAATSEFQNVFSMNGERIEFVGDAIRLIGGNKSAGARWLRSTQRAFLNRVIKKKVFKEEPTLFD